MNKTGEGERGKGRKRRLRVPAVAALLAAAVAFVLGVALTWSIGGNPLSDTNEVVYLDVFVGSVSPAGDQLCWTEDPEQRDTAQSCAILTLDPAAEPPQAGDPVTIGLVEVHPPEGQAQRQVVSVEPAAGGEPAGEEPTGEDS